MAEVVLQMDRKSAQQLRFVFLGMRARFSVRVLEGLLRSGLKPVAVWIAGARNENATAIRFLPSDTAKPAIPILNTFLIHDITHVAGQHGIPVYEVGDLASPDTLLLLRRLDVTFGIVACFPYKLPPDLLLVPSEGFLNLHPSLLPEFRGPYPLFWTFRSGARQSGVTVHVVDEGLDTGDIVTQRSIVLPDGISGLDADELFANKGVELLVQAVTGLTYGHLPRQPQAATGSYQGQPTWDDFTIRTTWPARQAFNFMRGTADWNQPYAIEGAAFHLVAHSAISFDPECILDEPLSQKGRVARVAFAPGWLEVRTV